LFKSAFNLEILLVKIFQYHYFSFRDEEAGLASAKKAFSLVIEEAKSDSDEDDFDGFSENQSQYEGYEVSMTNHQSLEV